MPSLDLTPDANILFASDSIIDILGYTLDEVKGTSCFNYFHPDEVLKARHVYHHGVQLQKAAVLQYFRIEHRDGHWINCECVFTIVYDVMVACLRVHCGDAKNESESPMCSRGKPCADEFSQSEPLMLQFFVVSSAHLSKTRNTIYSSTSLPNLKQIHKQVFGKPGPLSS